MLLHCPGNLHPFNLQGPLLLPTRFHASFLRRYLKTFPSWSACHWPCSTLYLRNQPPEISVKHKTDSIASLLPDLQQHPSTRGTKPKPLNVSSSLAITAPHSAWLPGTPVSPGPQCFCLCWALTLTLLSCRTHLPAAFSGSRASQVPHPQYFWDTLYPAAGPLRNLLSLPLQYVSSLRAESNVLHICVRPGPSTAPMT